MHQVLDAALPQSLASFTVLLLHPQASAHRVAVGLRLDGGVTGVGTGVPTEPLNPAADGIL